MDPLPVTIIVKAPNQQFEDQTIKCEPTWSIRKLKGYLSEVYPCNPTLEEQKLIYSGQLLNDAHILKDVLRRFEGQETHTVHLVYTPKNRQQQQKQSKPSQLAHKDANQQSRSQTSQASTTAPDGLRHRNVGSEVNTTSNGPQPFSGYMINPQQFMPGAWMPPNSTNSNPAQQSVQQYMMAQQMAMQNMMHQMYMQYMNQYGNTFQNMNPGSMPMPQYPQMNQFNQPNFGNVWNANVQNMNPTVDLQTQQQPGEQAPPVPAPPRIPANNDEEENRDWLEILYTLSRLLVLSSLVYFYSSPGRCSIVIIVALLYYLYQSHQRNVRERQQQQQGQIDRDADADVIDAPADNNNEQQQGENNANAENGEAADSLSASNGTSQETSSDGEQDRLPTTALLRTFILSFFSSLIPENPAV